MKKLLIFMLTIFTAFSICGCSSKNSNTENYSSNTNNSKISQLENISESGKLGNYDVTIKSAKKIMDSNNKPAIIINYEYTNNSSEPQSFIFSVCDIATQNDKKLNSAVILNNESYLSESSVTTVAPGSTVTVQKAFELVDENSPLRIEVTELLKPTESKIAKSFDLANIE